MNILEFLFWFPVSGCNVEQGTCYILVFCWCRWEFRPLGESTGEQTLSRDCQSYELTISGLGGNTVDLSCLIPDCYNVPISIQPVEWDTRIILNAWTDCESSIAVSSFLPTCFNVPLYFDGASLYTNYGTACQESVEFICPGDNGNIPVYHTNWWKQEWPTDICMQGWTVDYFINQNTWAQYVAFDDVNDWYVTKVKKYNPGTNDWDLVELNVFANHWSQISVVANNAWDIYLGVTQDLAHSNHFSLYEYLVATGTRTQVYESVWVSDHCSIDIDEANQVIYIVYNDWTLGRWIAMTYDISTTATAELLESWTTPFYVAAIIDCKIKYATQLWSDYVWVAWIDNNDQYPQLSLFAWGIWTYYSAPAAEQSDSLKLSIHEQSIVYMSYRETAVGYAQRLYTCNFPGWTQIDLTTLPSSGTCGCMNHYVDNLHDLYIVRHDTIMQCQSVYKYNWVTFDMIWTSVISPANSNINIIKLLESNKNIYVMGLNLNYGPNRVVVNYRDGTCVFNDSWIAAARMLPMYGNGDPTWVYTPRFVGDRFIDQDDPTVYTSYGMNNTDRIS